MKATVKINRALVLNWGGSQEIAGLVGESGMTPHEILDSKDITADDKVWLFFGTSMILGADNVFLAMCEVLDPYVERYCQSCGDPEIEDWANRWLAGERDEPCRLRTLGEKEYPWDRVHRAAAMAFSGLRYSACGLIACIADSVVAEYDRQFSIALSYLPAND